MKIFATTALILLSISIAAQKTKSTPKALKPIKTAIQPTKTEKNEFGQWLFIKSDKPVQYRFKKIKIEDNVGHFQVQFRINFEDVTFCDNPECKGYNVSYGFPQGKEKGSLKYKNFTFMNTFKGIYDEPEIVSIPINYPDGSSIVFKDGQFLASLPNGQTQPAYIFLNCIDLINTKYKSRDCYDFKEKEAIVLK
jgi:hypothetical protein